MGCSRGPRPVVKYAVLRFENLSGDRALEWSGRAMSEIVGTALSGEARTYVIPWLSLRAAGDGSRPAAAPGISAERAPALLAGAQRLVYGQVSLVRGRLRADAAVENPSTGKIVATAWGEGASATDVIGAAEALARRIAQPVRAFGTTSPAALKLYAEALDQDSLAAVEADLQKAVAADPTFGQAYVMAIWAAVGLHDRESAMRLVEAAGAHRDGMTPLDRAWVELHLAGSRADAGARKRALLALTRLYPADPSAWTTLSEIAMAGRDYAEAGRYLRAVTALHPDEPLLFNQLGYAEAYAGNLAAALAAGQRYQRLRPRDANPLDSLGDFSLHLGRMRDAERYYEEASRRAPAFLEGLDLFKAAWARLMTGDVKGADAIFDRYLAARTSARDPAAPLRHAQWDWLAGRRREAIARLADLDAATPAELASQARMQLALWKLELGGEARTPESLRQFPAPYAALLAGDFRGALPLLEQAYSRWTPGRDPGVPVLLAWAYAETGRYQDAAPLVERNPMPPAGLDVFTSLWFPRLFAVRAQVLAKQGRTGDAQESYRIFQALAAK